VPGKLNRWMKLLNILHSRNGLSMQNLMEEFEVSERTIHRDLEALRATGYPIEYDEGLRCYSVNQRYSLRTLYLGDSEAVALLQAIDAFNQEGFPYATSLELVREKIVTCLSPSMRNGVEQRLDVCDIDFAQPYTIPDALFKDLENAAVLRRQVRIVYDTQTSSRVVDPYGLVCKDKTWYLIAFCHKRNEVRIFRPDRIAQIEVLETTFLQPKEFCLQRFFDNSWQIGQGETVQVKIRFLPHIAQTAKKVRYHPLGIYTDMEDGSVLYEVTVKGLWEISRWVLSFGPGVQVLEPVDLREMVKDLLTKACQIYR